MQKMPINIFNKTPYGWTFAGEKAIRWFMHFIVDKVIEKINNKELIMSFCPCDTHERGFIPVYKTAEAACADVALPEDVSILPGEIKKIPLDISFEIANDFKIVMYPRSSLLEKYHLMSPTSIIDSDYSGKIVHWPVINLGKDTVTLERGTRVAQIECAPRHDCQSWKHERGERTGGFGSTGEAS